MLYLVCFLCVLGVYYISQVLYHLYLSPLRNVPSPWIFQWFPWYYQYLSARGNAPFVVYDYHRKWGPVFRVGWKTVLFVDGEKAAELHKTYKCGKTKLYNSYNYAGESLFSTRSRDIHKQRKHMVAPAYSKANTRLMEPFIIAAGVRPMISKLNKAINDNVPVIDMYHQFHYMAWDIIGEIGLGCSFNMLKNGAHPAVDWLNDTLKYCTQCYMFPIMRKFACQSLINLKKFVWEVLEDYEGKQSSKLRVTRSAPIILDFFAGSESQDTDEKLDREAIFAEVNLILLGGTDTTSNALNFFLCHLAINQNVQDNVCKEIKLTLSTEPLVDGMISHATCQKYLVYLEAAIKETLRLTPPGPIAFLRSIPKGGLNVMGYNLPEGTECGISVYAVHRSPHLWKNSEEFRPSRWLSNDYKIGSLSNNPTVIPEKVRKLSPHFMPFMFGPRACIGRDLAMMEMMVIAANLLYHFQFDLLSQEMPTLVASPNLRPRDSKLDFIITRRHLPFP